MSCTGSSVQPKEEETREEKLRIRGHRENGGGKRGVQIYKLRYVAGGCKGVLQKSKSSVIR